MSCFPTLDLTHIEAELEDVRNSSPIAPRPDLVVAVELQSKLGSSMRTINAEFIALGYPHMFSIENGLSKVHLQSFAQSTLRLLQSYMKMITVKDNLECRLHSVESDLTHLQRLYQRSQENLNEAQRLHGAARERERQAEVECKTLNNRLKSTTEELRKSQLNFQRHETQTRHERRKLEGEFVRLRERLSSQMSSRQKSISVPYANSRMRTAEVHSSNDRRPPRSMRVPGRTIQTLPHSSEDDRSVDNVLTSNTDIPFAVCRDEKLSQVEMYKTVIQQMEERQHVLSYENRELRDLLSQMSSRLFRFTAYLQHRLSPHKHSSPHNSRSDADENLFDSLDEPDDEDLLHHSVRRDSSDDCGDDSSSSAQRTATFDSHCANFDRRKSARVNQLLLELPYPVIRNQLMQRIRHLSRKLWLQIKRIPHQAGFALTDPIEKSVRKQIQELTTETEDETKPLKDENEDQLAAEVAHLKCIIRDYETLLKEQEFALKNALFTNAKRRIATDQSHHQSHMSADQEFISNSIADAYVSAIQERQSVPTDGSGDGRQQTMPAFNSKSVELRDREVGTLYSTHGLSKDNEFQRPHPTSDRHDFSSDHPRDTASSSNFTSSPFPARYRSSSVQKNT